LPRSLGLDLSLMRNAVDPYESVTRVLTGLTIPLEIGILVPSLCFLNLSPAVCFESSCLLGRLRLSSLVVRVDISLLSHILLETNWLVFRFISKPVFSCQ
jgi:hypothetical protein